ncbi:MAG: hypothetical protein IJD68_02630 [Ruminococcus sp.]|nr:hypothetical protein [Ruminococcus sp.]
MIILQHLNFENDVKPKEKPETEITDGVSQNENDAMAKKHQVVKEVKSDYTAEREDNMKLDIKNDLR